MNPEDFCFCLASLYVSVRTPGYEMSFTQNETNHTSLTAFLIMALAIDITDEHE